MNSKFYKYCAVPFCHNTTIKTPQKLFVYVPRQKEIRKEWFRLAGREDYKILISKNIYFCEDHFDMPNDMENFMEYHIMGAVSQIRMKSGSLPTKFHCQPNRKVTSCISKFEAVKTQKTFFEECIRDDDKNEELVLQRCDESNEVLSTSSEKSNPCKRHSLEIKIENRYQFIEVDDICLMNQFIDAEGNIWDRKSFIKSHDENLSEHVIDECETNSPNIKAENPEEWIQEESKTFMNMLVDEKGRISHKKENSEELKIYINDNRTVIPKTEAEKESQRIGYELIDADENAYHEGKSFEESVKREKVEEEVSASPGEMVEHDSKSFHGEPQVHKCNLCDFSTLQNHGLINHLKNVHLLETKNHKCIHCDYQTNQKGHLKHHTDSVHLGIKNHKCSHCNYRSTDKSTLKRHTNIVHLGIKNHKCTLCYYRSTHIDHLERHVNRVHLGIKSYKCSECDHQTNDKSDLQLHMESVHLDMTNYKCNQCDYQATQKGHLKVHIKNVHLGIKNFKCSQCDYRANQSSHLKQHIKSVHLGIKEYKCSECSYRAAQSSNLKQHVVNVHLGIKSHQCSHCDYETSRKNYLNRHMNSVHFVTKCGQCDYQASEKGELKRHLKSVHYL
ncbi:hypothetical protein HHI36_005433 [Cryptolaemus montrouzieri]|uniref:Uncharacterized protein n=1 Tax=Cryptolaemus montrouzieri TaxID=559131 RepID=A0ABD2NUE1_9CUCU